MKNRIAGILLAAGQSSRFGSQKLTCKLPGSEFTIAEQSAYHLLQVLPHSIAIIRKGDDQLNTLLSSTGIAIVENAHADTGISSSIRCGIQYLAHKNLSDSSIKGYLIALADMPFISPATIKTLEETLLQGHLLCAPQFEKKRGHPVGFSAQLETELLALQGDVGARPLLNKFKNKLYLVEVDCKGVLLDIDYSDDLLSQNEI